MLFLLLSILSFDSVILKSDQVDESCVQFSAAESVLSVMVVINNILLTVRFRVCMKELTDRLSRMERHQGL